MKLSNIRLSTLLLIGALFLLVGCFSVDSNTAVEPEEKSDNESSEPSEGESSEESVDESSEAKEDPSSEGEESPSSEEEENVSSDTDTQSDTSEDPSSDTEDSSSEEAMGSSVEAMDSSVEAMDSSVEAIVTGTDNAFTLVINDEFDDLDLDFWELSDGSWDDNRTMFVDHGVEVSGGLLKLIMTSEYVEDRVCWGQRRLAAPGGESPIPGQDGTKYFSSGELRSLKMFKYGRFETTIKAPQMDHYLSTFFLFNVPRDEQWLEIDIELMSEQPGKSTTNLLIDKDGGAAVWGDIAIKDQLRSHDNAPIVHQEDNEFAIEWTKDYVAWFINGIQVRKETDAALIPTKPLYAVFNFWMGHVSLSGNPPGGYLEGETAETEYKYFRYYKWNGEENWENEGWCGDKSWNGIRCE